MKKTKEKKPVSKLKRTINIITTVVSCIFLALLLVCLVAVFVSKFKGEQPNLFGYSFLYIETGSMEPDFPIGSSILVKKCKAEDIKVGDIVSYYHSEELSEAFKVKFTTHKCVEALHTNPETGKQFITTQGIAPKCEPEEIEAEKVYAVLVSKVPTAFNKLFGFLLTPFGLATLIAVPLLVALALQLYSQVKVIIKKEKEKTDEELLQEEISKQTEIISQEAKDYFEQEQEKIKEFLEKQKKNEESSDNE